MRAGLGFLLFSDSLLVIAARPASAQQAPMDAFLSALQPAANRHDKAMVALRELKTEGLTIQTAADRLHRPLPAV